MHSMSLETIGTDVTEDNDNEECALNLRKWHTANNGNFWIYISATRLDGAPINLL